MKKETKEKQTNVQKGAEWYREKIVEMVNNIENLGTLQYLHRFLELFLEKWG